ncbi:MAG: type II toxin-antitoxin system Phd/YefM family antitoxin [Betaproteobacteria bacterium]|nr:type II toxin-antitoxin system Phd/YefM family antitoxin [Betaproteobacteria bacterium]
MGFAAKDIVPLTQARARLSELADEVKAGSEKIITRNGESYVALVDAARLDHYHRLEREHIHLMLIDDAEKGLEDIAAGRTVEARSALKKRRAKRSAD